MSSLKDALEKAGFKPTKKENVRPKLKKRELTVQEKHQTQCNYCEVCQKTLPDVEQYKHPIAFIDAEWICLACADKNKIDDKFRTTAQSDFAKKGIFKREYGPTQRNSVFNNNNGPTASRSKSRS